MARPDRIIIGAGIFGLWAARHALKRGERVLVLEKRHVGAGASGGFLGALMPHMPDNWNAKKQMQFEGLCSLPQAIAALEEDTGIDCGYRRCGRLMPLSHERMIGHARERIAGAAVNWKEANGDAFAMTYLEPGFAGNIAEGWLSEALAPFGATYDDLSARVNPRAYLEALKAYVQSDSHGRGEIREEADAVSLSVTPSGVEVGLADGGVVSAGQVVVANGWEAYRLLGSFGASIGGQIITGRGVKGQAVLLDHVHKDNRPILYDNGSYIVPHGKSMGTDARGAPNRVAVGSTSVNDWMQGDPAEVNLPACDDSHQENASTAFDPADMGFYNHAISLCPSLSGAAIAERWANVRPRNTMKNIETGKIGSEPIFGPVDDHQRVSVAIGGFKISFGVGHLPLVFSR